MSQKGNGAKNDTAEVVRVSDPVFKVGELDEFSSFEQAIEFLNANGVELTPANQVLGDGFEGVDKEELVNVPFVILKVTKSMSKEFNSPMVVIHAMTVTSRKVRFTDGSTGILGQLAMFKERFGRDGVGMVVKGLTVSKYTVMERDENGEYVRDGEGNPIPMLNNGKEISAKTYYLSTEPIK